MPLLVLELRRAVLALDQLRLWKNCLVGDALHKFHGAVLPLLGYLRVPKGERRRSKCLCLRCFTLKQESAAPLHTSDTAVHNAEYREITTVVRTEHICTYAGPCSTYLQQEPVSKCTGRQQEQPVVHAIHTGTAVHTFVCLSRHFILFFHVKHTYIQYREMCRLAPE